MQKPEATNVAGIRTWNSLGRFVKRGEKGIFILAPMIGKKRSRDEEATSEDADKKDGQPRLYGFRGVYVFDITQTEGKELATLTEVSGDVSGYGERLFKFVERQNVELSFSERIGPAKGLSHGLFFPSMRRRCDVNRSVWLWASIVCLRFLAERPSADGRGFSHRSSEASRRGTLTGSSPVCTIRVKTKAKLARERLRGMGQGVSD